MGERQGSGAVLHYQPDKVLIPKAVRCRHQPLVRNQGGAAKMPLVVGMEADLPRPLAHVTVLPANNSRLLAVGAAATT